MNFKFSIYVFLGGLIHYGDSQIATVVLNFENALLSRSGLGWPPEINVAQGNEALMKLRGTLTNLQSCTVTDPSGTVFDIRQPPSNRYQKWSDGCGVRVKDIKKNDEGRWRLTANRSNDTITGWIELTVLEDTTSYTPPPISLQDGESHAKVDLTTMDNAYCVVAKPFAESSLIPGRCTVTLDRTTRAVQGNWNVYLGLPGRVSELQTKRHVTVQTERLDVGYVHDASNKLHLYCNILHSNKEITFCRFQRTASSTGYNVIDGLSDGSYSYYGDGFASKQCGMTIENPSSQDYVTWRCSVGVQMMVGNQMQQQTPMQSLISVAQNFRSLQSSQRSNDDAQRTVFVQKNTPFTVTCNAKVSLAYCWFQHPNGTQYTPVPLVNEGQLFWYTGEGLNGGDCGITFAHANESDDGLWSCFMGPRGTLGVELTDEVEVRVTGPLAANRREVPAVIGHNATLYCHSANGRRPLNYCRFLSPNFVGINIDSSVTAENPIMNRFIFTPDRDLNFGDCSLTIMSVREEDMGEWVCAAVVDDEVSESRQTINVYKSAEAHVPRAQAGIIGMAVSGSFLAMALVGYVAYKRRWVQLPQRFRRPTTASAAVGFTAHSGSISSGSSNEPSLGRPSSC